MLYIGDNGRIFCREHGGQTFKATGRDLSGAAVHQVNDRDRANWRRIFHREFECETCAAVRRKTPA